MPIRMTLPVALTANASHCASNMLTLTELKGVCVVSRTVFAFVLTHESSPDFWCQSVTASLAYNKFEASSCLAFADGFA